ncbi:DNA-formamidopyrimidine glycosylase family protein [Homoserinibacter sp. YIM 151385]|uniref:DNA-formamidopyrimidine glycosylase family protein n=1 Tax=Homoserinibacter sp. YIM 151385 TaxID=2985506 RepID=UPI0022F06E96|nr:DNA-formamidopyrimidine glycosylase family protein [Homoserinibacter sp. YIM 151385]WBU37621.1 Fpg/Nei family DNA glycosylase [Homoserinibacter sp. YIM 151385]
MPEGDTVWRAARAQHAALAGQVLERSDLRVPRFATADLSGETVHEVVARGKHLLHRIGDLTLHTHLKMEGRWTAMPRGDRWPRPAHEARVVLETTTTQAVGFSLGIVELVPTAEEDRVVGHLGPDILGPDWDAARAVANLEADAERPAFVAVLDQRNLAGLGNVYANELLFLRGIDPHRPVREVADVPALVDLASRLILANRDRSMRITTGDSRPGARTWVYGRGGRPCRRCGTRIRRGELGADELSERIITWCPSCQG